MRKKEIVFDPEKRKDFLSGFQKRKNERRTRAKEQLERSIKEERKRIRNDLKNSMAHMKKTFQPLSIDPELEGKGLEKDYEDDEVQINVIELAGKPLLDEENDNDHDASEDSTKESGMDTILGMEYNVEEVEKEGKNKCKPKREEPISELGKFGNKKMLDKLKKKKSLKEFKKSKVFKQKERIEKKKQQKISRREKKFSKNGSGASGNKIRFKRQHSAGRGKRK